MSINLKVRNLNAENKQHPRESKVDVGINFGRILSETSGSYSIDLSGITAVAMQAPSCLVNPKAGDYVACISDGNRLFISTILERDAKEAPIEIKFDDPIQLSAPDIALMGEKQLALTSQRGDLNFSEMALRAMKLEASVDEAKTSIKNLTHIGRTIKTTLSEILLRAGMALRVIDGTDHQKSSEAYIIAEKFLSMRGEMTSVAAKKDVKIDGSRVHIG